MPMEYTSLGFKAGLEIHQQLATQKLFCQCASEIKEGVDYSFERLLRPTQSEMGDVDCAALEEARRKRRFVYTASNISTCLVEADEEPPHAANAEAIDICLTAAMLVEAHPVDEIQFMRKIVIDGSNTTGFQRTALIAINGMIKNVRITSLALEEDAARKITEKEQVVTYGLDRLGIPLIEITTAADITSPEHAREVAEHIGLLLQATKKVKRGLGTIRQDLNISIANGARIEVKGIQSLSAISKVAENEVLRQKDLLEISDILRKREKKTAMDAILAVNLTSLFTQTKSKLIQHHVTANECVKGIRLPGFQGLLHREYSHLGKDLAVYARIASGIGGIIHSDEMPGYGLSQEEIQQIRQNLHIGEADAFILALGNESMVDLALSAVAQRATMFFDGVPEEVHRSLPDDTTEYMRPLPGAARMYPETDVPPIRITADHLQQIILPEKTEEKRIRLITQYTLHPDQVAQLLSHGYEDDFERLAKQFPDQKNVILRTFLNTFSELENGGISIEPLLQEPLLGMVFSALSKGHFAKEAIPRILHYLVQHPNTSIVEAIRSCDLESTGDEEMVAVIRRIIIERKDFIKERGPNSLGPLMGVVMKELRGKIDGQRLSKALQQEIQKIMES